MKYFFHQMSAILAFCDVVQCLGIFLDSPWLNSTCYVGAYLFLIGSLSKVLCITYITAIIAYVVIWLSAPTKNRKIAGGGFGLLLVVISSVALLSSETAEILCLDKAPVTLNYDDVSQTKRRVFFVFYVFPISICFFWNMFITAYATYCYRKIVSNTSNKSLGSLLRRLFPFAMIFSLAFFPTAIFFLRGYATDNEDDVNKTFAIMGQVLSGTLYAMSYAYYSYFDVTFVSSARKRILKLEKANESCAESTASACNRESFAMENCSNYRNGRVSDNVEMTEGCTHNPMK